MPSELGLTPGSLRGGGAVAAYRHGWHISDILWQMRLRHSVTLEHYLQEVAAVSVAAELPEQSRGRIRVMAASYGDALQYVTESQ